MKHLPLDTLEKTLGHQFANRELLQQALTHSSFASESAGTAQDNEQLEFLGDAVLQFVASQELFQRFPSYQEGELSRLRAHLVNANHLMHCAQEMQLGGYLRLGHSEEKTGRRKITLLADALEALLAALYLDAGLPLAREFVLSRILDPELERLSISEGGVLAPDPRSRLQELLQADGRPGPRYEMVSADGPPHRRTFTMQVIVLTPGNETEFATVGNGNSKKAAIQVAAQKALDHLQANGNG